MASTQSGPRALSRGFWFIGLEFIAIVFGVFLGGYLADRRSDRDLDELIARSRTAIQSELQTNYQELLFAREYHIRLYTLSSEAVATQNIVPVMMEMRRGFGLPQIQTGALDAAVAAGLVVYFDQDEFARISRTYKIAQLSEGTDIPYISALLTAEKEDVPRVFASAFRQFVSAEDAALNEMASLVGQDPPTRFIPEMPKRPAAD